MSKPSERVARMRTKRKASAGGDSGLKREYSASAMANAAQGTSGRAPRQPRQSEHARPATTLQQGCPFQHIKQEKEHKATYASLIAMAIYAAPSKKLTLNEIYSFVSAHRGLVPTASQPNWKNSIRHNLSLRKCFSKMPRLTKAGKKLSAYWTLDETCLPSAAQAMVKLIDDAESVKFPTKFLDHPDPNQAADSSADKRVCSVSPRKPAAKAVAQPAKAMAQPAKKQPAPADRKDKPVKRQADTKGDAVHGIFGAGGLFYPLGPCSAGADVPRASNVEIINSIWNQGYGYSNPSTPVVSAVSSRAGSPTMESYPNMHHLLADEGQWSAYQPMSNDNDANMAKRPRFDKPPHAGHVGQDGSHPVPPYLRFDWPQILKC